MLVFPRFKIRTAFDSDIQLFKRREGIFGVQSSQGKAGVGSQ
jgi:hypothetical protein